MYQSATRNKSRAEIQQLNRLVQFPDWSVPNQIEERSFQRRNRDVRHSRLVRNLHTATLRHGTKLPETKIPFEKRHSLSCDSVHAPLNISE
jgi:hypothetical protein